MNKPRLLAALMALTLLGHAHAAGDTFTDVLVDTPAPHAAEPVTLSFPGLTGACTVNISTDVQQFFMQGNVTVQQGKLTFVPHTTVGNSVDYPFNMTVSSGSYGNACTGLAKTLNIPVNGSRLGTVAAEIGMLPMGKPVNIIVGGNDYRSCDGAALDFGDGSPVQQVSGTFPFKVSHVYTQAGSYKQSAKANGATCYGSAVSEFKTTVMDDAALAKITGLLAGADSVDKTAASIKITGNPGGACERAFIDWGDGSSPQQVSGNFPLLANHPYQDGGNKTIKVAAAAGFNCNGQAQSIAYIYPKQAKFSGATPAASNATTNQDVTIELAGSGICQNVSVALGDNLNTINVGMVNFAPFNNFKWPVKVKYSKAGVYTLYVKDNGGSACGILTPKVTVAEPQLNVTLVMPHNRPTLGTPVATAPATTPGATPPKPKPATPAKGCAKKNGQQVDPNCVED